ncbi:sigma 54-interacting transcriptional regulator [Brevibacillus sp. NRS-1366]|uniref:sigma 54-interacting transcriptional regulator n=1 Tax=Brevibacillus sp. NRS-1366 TaxID=3233899 RepID=UPI003D234407
MNLLGNAIREEVVILDGNVPAIEAGWGLANRKAAAALVRDGNGTFLGVITTETILQAMLEQREDTPLAALPLQKAKCMQMEEWQSLAEYEVEHLYRDATHSCLLMEGEKPVRFLAKVEMAERLHHMLRSGKAELQLIFDHSFDEIYVADGSGVTLYVNQACQRTTGKPPAYYIGKSCFELEQEGDIIHSVNPKVIETKKTQTGKIIVNGKQFIVTANPVLDEQGELYRIISNVRDVTELVELQKRLEEAEELIGYYRDELNQLRSGKTDGKEIIASSKVMTDILQLAQKIAAVDSTVLLLGETGVGKGALAKHIHDHSLRKDEPFVHINCGAIPGNLLESELFGYEGGAFTGAERRGKTGLVESAAKGTLFLDEIAEIPPSLQVKILQVIQEKRFTKVGGKRPIEADVRIIAATHRDLKQMVKTGDFREDLYYRIHVIPIQIPAIRYRPEDCQLMIEHFLQDYNGRFGRNVRLDTDALPPLLAYHWPGNVREIENLMERLVVTVERNRIGVEDLPDYIRHTAYSGEKAVSVKQLVPIREAVEEVEKQIVQLAWKQYRTSRKVARILGINQATVLRKMQKYQIGEAD